MIDTHGLIVACWQSWLCLIAHQSFVTVLDGDDWLVIDPKGFIGDPVFEVCAFIHNPIPELLDQENSIEIINQRIQYCAKNLGYSIQRIQDWLYVKSVLCWAWCLDDNIDPSHFKQFVMLLGRGDYHYE